jgi:hypothetical protein
MTQKLLFFKNLIKNPKKKSKLAVRKDGENFKPYYSFVALSSKKLSANKRTDRQKLQNMYKYDLFFFFLSYYFDTSTNSAVIKIL